MSHRLTWHNIKGLTMEQRRAGARAWPNLNLAVVAITKTSVDGVVIPDIIYGNVYTGYRFNLDVQREAEPSEP